MNNIGLFIQDTNQNHLRLPLSPNPRDKNKRQKYIAAVQRFLDIEATLGAEGEKGLSAEQISKLFLENVGVKIFRILYKQLRGVDLTG